MLSLFDDVRLLADKKDSKGRVVKAGTEGTILEVFTNPQGYIADFSMEGDDAYLVDLYDEDIEKVED